MMISVCIVSGFSVSADSSIEVYFENSSNWSTVKAYAWNFSTNQTYLGDFPGTDMTFVKDKVYKISVSASADKIIFNGGSDASKTGDLTIPSSSGKIYKNGTWSDYSETPVAVGTYEYNAKTDSSFNNASYVASCSLYDYLDDQELSSGIWGNVKTAGNSATWFPFSKYNSILSNYYSSNSVKKPLYYGNLNTGSAGETSRHNEYNSNIGSLYSYDAAPNNSKAVWYDCETSDVNVNDTGKLASCADPGSWAYSYQGIVSRKLASDGSLQLMKNDNASSVAAPFFSDSFLSKQYSGTNTMLGRKVNTALPFIYDNNTKKYSYKSSTTTHESPVNGIYLANSQRGSSTNNLNGVSSNSLTMMYGGSNTSTAILDGKTWFNSGDSGYGFFPFNNNTGSHTNNDVRNDLNYGFGMVLTVDFTVPTNGCIEGTSNPVEFTFKGDDDIWIFIDEKLVVDLGGDHKEASCTLNFKDKTTNYNTGCNKKAVTSASDEYTLSEVMAGSTGNTVHTLKLFYMERGLIESNLQVEFSFSPIDNYLTTTKTVDTTDVNFGIKSAVSNADGFEFKNVSNGASNNTTAALSGKTYAHTAKNKTESVRTSDSRGAYTMKDGETAAFTNITDTGNYITVSEDTSGNVFNYTSTYTVTDVQNKTVKVNNASGTSANFLFKNEANEKQATNYRVDFVNKPQVNNLSVSKIAKDDKGNAINDAEFDFNVALAFDGTENYESYPLVYEIGGIQYTATNGDFKLKGGQTAVFKNIPVGAKYLVTEAPDTDYTTEPSSRTFKDTIGSGSASNSITFTNTKINKSPASVDISAVKLLDGVTPDVNTFEFTLKELTINGSGFVEGKTVQTVANSRQNVVFDTLQYEYEEPPQPATTAPVTKPTTQPTTAAPTTQPTTVAPTTVPASNMVYLKPNSNWTQSNAWFAIYVFNGSNNSWAKMNSAGNGYYSAEIPSGNWSKIIFCRMNPASSNLDWSNKWDQTNDLDIPTGSNKCYTVAEGAWSNGNGSWGAVPGLASLSKANYSMINASSADKYYYKISEKADPSNTTYFYDSTEYYVVVTVNRSVAPITASAKYYKTASDAINETSAIQPGDVKFNNYHKGSLEITKKAGNGTAITDTVTFKLYKADANGASLEESKLVGSKKVDSKGVVTFDNLELFVNQSSNDTSAYQWYCFVETKAKEGFNINDTKYYFTIPLAQANEDQSSNSYDFESGGTKYSYVLKDGKPVYNIKCDVDNFPVVSPNTSGTGVNVFLVIGLGLIGTGAATVIGYTLYNKAQRRKRREKHARD